jgi:superfamily II DNA/RNA helicase
MPIRQDPHSAAVRPFYRNRRQTTVNPVVTSPALLQNLSIPDLWQQQAVRALREGHDVVVHAPTGAGKTFIFELLYPSLKGQAVFSVPTRALANDKLAEWRKRGWEVGIATGDIAEGLDRKVVVATLETQRNRLLSAKGPRLLVIDEYQLIADPVRGVHYELSIALAPSGTQLLLLSGSVANPQEVVKWLQRIGRKALLVAHHERPVPLVEVDLPGVPDRSPAGLRNWWPRMIRNALAEDMGPILLFAPRRRAAEQLAAELAAALPPCAPLALSEPQVQLAGRQLAKMLRARVAFHHSGLSFAQRAQLVEPLAKEGQLRVVVATMGLAAGINFSMRSVAVSGTAYSVGGVERKVSSAELLQMFGRAGRRGLDDTGYALVSNQPPRLLDAHPLPLRRSAQLDWPTLIAVMHHAALRGEAPYEAAVRLNSRLFATDPVPIGCEHSLHAGPSPCGLWVDAERARHLRRGTLEMWGSSRVWEKRPAAPERGLLSEMYVQAASPKPQVTKQENNTAQETDSPRQQASAAQVISTGSDATPQTWVPAMSQAAFMQRFGSGPLCRLPGPLKRYGREIHLGVRRGDGTLALSPRLRRLLALPAVAAEELSEKVLARLPEATGGGVPVALLPRGDQLFAQLDYGSLREEAWRDANARLLLDPPTRKVLPPACSICPQREWCETTPISQSAAYAWRELGLTHPDGTPTRRGVVFSFFQHGEGLAIAAALEDPRYALEDLVFDLADLRGGPRFADEDGQASGRLGMVCQRVFRNADYPGYLEFGIPSTYGAGASEVIRGIIRFGRGKQEFLSDTLRLGDIERALLEWQSLLRHCAHAPEYPWDRWEAFRAEARTTLKY